MAEAAIKLPVKTEEKAVERPSALREWRPLENLRREMDRLFDEFDWRSPFRRSVFDMEPLWRRELIWATTPAVDIVEKDKAYEVTAELPGMDESNIEVKLVKGTLTIRVRSRKRRRRRRKTTISPSAVTAPSNAASRFLKASTPARSRLISRRVCSR